MMKRFILDTNVVVEILHGNRKIIEKIERIGRRDCCISEITIAELYYGAVKGGNPKNFQDIAIVESLFEIIPIYSAYLNYAKIRYHLVSKGIGIDTFDMLIGASAIQLGYTLVTHNIKHFERIPKIQLEDWQC